MTDRQLVFPEEDFSIDSLHVSFKSQYWTLNLNSSQTAKCTVYGSCFTWQRMYFSIHVLLRFLQLCHLAQSYVAGEMAC